MKKLNIVALVLLTLAIAFPASFATAAANTDTEKSQVLAQKININTANEEQLQEVPGIGPATAGKILSYRNDHGSFSDIEQLLDVKGIGPKSLEKMKPYLTL